MKNAKSRQRRRSRHRQLTRKPTRWERLQPLALVVAQLLASAANLVATLLHRSSKS